MTKSEFALLSKIGLKVGIIASVSSILLEALKYILEFPFLYSGISSLVYLLSLTIILLTTTWFFARPAILNFWNYFLIMLFACVITSIVNSFSLIGVHHMVDLKYKERIADYKIEAVIESTANLEKRLNAKVTTTIDFEEFRKSEIAKFELLPLSRLPIQMLPFSLIFSLLLSAVLWKVQKRSRK